MQKSEFDRNLHIDIDERRISIIVFILYSSWLLAFPFQGQILYSLSDKFGLEPNLMIFSFILSHFLGLIFCGCFIKSIKFAKKMAINSIVFSFIASIVFFSHLLLCGCFQLL